MYYHIVLISRRVNFIVYALETSQLWIVIC